ncbi:hypothetical protein ABEP17_19625 [Priestia flexa]|uniref:hypothetical protein n=1 Tax=Priestia flexa TaxID=86664 RepID=UPI003D2D2E51
MSTVVDELSLLDNAIDSLKHGLAHIIDHEVSGDISDIKQGIMNLVNSIDLFILEKVRQKDERLIYENEKHDKYGIVYRQTIKAEKAYRLIKGEVDQITEEEFKAYDILKILRNAATHSTFSYGEDREGNIIFLMHYIARFLENELEIDLQGLIEEDMFKFYHNKIRDLDYGEVLQERIFAAIESEISILNFISVKDGGTPVVADWCCHECGREGISLDEDLAPYGNCAYCGYEHRVGTCDVCGVLFDVDWEGQEYEDGLSLCEYHSDIDNFD